MNKFYCQRDIEGESACDVQCDHCKDFYTTLEKVEKKKLYTDVSLEEIEKAVDEAFNKKGPPERVLKIRTWGGGMKLFHEAMKKAVKERMKIWATEDFKKADKEYTEEINNNIIWKKEKDTTQGK